MAARSSCTRRRSGRWDEFKHFTAQVAVEFLAEDASARYARDRTVGRNDRRSREAARLGAEAESRSRDVLGRAAARPSTKTESARSSRASRSRFRSTCSCTTWRMACWNRRRPRDSTTPRRRFTWSSRRRSCCSSTASRCDGGGRHRPRGDRQREFPGVSATRRAGSTTCCPASIAICRGETRRTLGHDRRAAAGVRQNSRARRVRADRGRRRDAAEGRRRADGHHDVQAGGDRRARRQAAGPRDRGHRRARVDREHREPAVPPRRHVLPAGRGPLVLDEGSRARAVEVHDAVAGCVRAHPGRRRRRRTCAHPCPARSRRAAPCSRRNCRRRRQ